MIEVFKTNITSAKKASHLVAEIQKNFAGYKVNFDLSDCDKILRLICNKENFCCLQFITWLKAKGCFAEVLPD